MFPAILAGPDLAFVIERGPAAQHPQQPPITDLPRAAASPVIPVYLSVALASFDVFRLAWSRGGFAGWIIQLGSSAASYVLGSHGNVHG